MRKKTFKQQMSVFTDDTRNRIICMLSLNECCVMELVQMLDIPQPNISRHLEKLMRAGALVCTVEGRNKYYSLNETFVRKYPNQIKEVCEAYEDEISIMSVDICKLSHHKKSRFQEKEYLINHKKYEKKAKK